MKIIGATAHFVNNCLDEGPIIKQDVIPVDHSYSAADMAKAGRDVEKKVFSAGLWRWYSMNRSWCTATRPWCFNPSVLGSVGSAETHVEFFLLWDHGHIGNGHFAGQEAANLFGGAIGAVTHGKLMQ